MTASYVCGPRRDRDTEPEIMGSYSPKYLLKSETWNGRVFWRRSLAGARPPDGQIEEKYSREGAMKKPLSALRLV
jgi:hypothetical protein